MVLKIFLVRHGQSFANLDTEFAYGNQMNGSPLTELGKEQARSLGLYLNNTLAPQRADLEGVTFYSSTAARARETALIAMEHLQVSDPLKVLVQSEELLELDLGNWHGLPRSEVFTPETIAKMEMDPYRFKSDGGESQEEVEQRVYKYISEQVVPRATPGRPALVFMHGLAIKCLLRKLLDSSPHMTKHIEMDYTAVTEIQHQEGKKWPWRVVRMNDTAHLAVAEAARLAASAAEEGVRA